MMSQSNIDEFVSILGLAEEANDITLLFSKLPISAIVEQATNLTKDEDNIDIYMPILLKHFDILFDQIKNKTEAGNLLLAILAQTSNGITYKYAQSASLGCALDLDESMSKALFRMFQTNYLRQKNEEAYHFIAALSLEGLVMLPILRSDGRQFVSALGVLFNDFPDIPSDTEASADLAIKALKLLGRCYDFRPRMNEIAEKVQEYIGVANIAVDTEARFYRGITKLYDAFSSADSEGLRHNLSEARHSFEEARYGHENRSDAELFYSITDCYLMLMSNPQPSEVKAIIGRTQDLLVERLLLNGRKGSYYQAEAEYHMVGLINWLGKWFDEIDSAKTWPSIIPPMRLLAHIYAGIRKMESLTGIIKAASQSTSKFVLLPDMEGRFIQVQEMMSKIEQTINSPSWRNEATEEELAFYELAQNILSSSTSPKVEAAASEKVRAAASLNPVFAQLIPDLDTLNQEQLVDKLLNSLGQKFREPVKELGGPGWDIYQDVIVNLQKMQILGYDSVRGNFVMAAVQLSIKYLLRAYRASPENSLARTVKFLFASDSTVEGIGSNAVEADLELHLYDYINLNEQGMMFRRQPVGDTSGKPDLSFVFADSTFFPVEIKREFDNISRENIHTHFIAQAQSYAAGSDQVSFLFVLDLTSKNKGEPLIDLRNCCFIDQISNPNAQYKDAVIVFIIPANRYLPSEHSTYSRPRKRRAKSDD